MLSPAVGVLEFRCVRCSFLRGVWGNASSRAWPVPHELLLNVILFPRSSYEDLNALDGGDDGMGVIRTILTLAPSLLKDSG